MSELSIETRRIIELGIFRQAWVDTGVQRKIDRNPNVEVAVIDGWEKEAYRRWRDTYPALASMFPSVLGVSDE